MYDEKAFFTPKLPNHFNEITIVKPKPENECLRLTTFNCKNIKTSGLLFEKFMKTEDIILIQEHWLFSCQMQLLDEINEQYNVSGKSVDHFNPITPVQIPRGYGGVAIFWKKEIDYLVSDKDIGIELLTQHPLLVVCVYLPCSGDKDNYLSFVETIEQLQEIIDTFKDTHEIIIGEDFNENAVVHTNLKRNVYFHKFLQENELMTRRTGHTFVHPNGKRCFDN